MFPKIRSMLHIFEKMKHASQKLKHASEAIFVKIRTCFQKSEAFLRNQKHF